MVRYSHCPRKPEGYKWEVMASGSWGHACWGMDTFAEALAYLRRQTQRKVMHPQDARGWIDGPGGRMEWDTIKTLARGKGVSC